MKFNGYRASHRNKWLLLQNKVLTQDELMLLEFYIDQMDFDGKHKNGGLFEYFPEEISPIFCKKSSDTIRGWHDGLANKGFIVIADTKRQLWSINNRERYINDANFMGKASQYAKEEKDSTVENIISTMSYFPKNYKNFPPFLPKILKMNNSIAKGSSKGVSITTPTSTEPFLHESRTMADYERIRLEDNYLHLTVDDMIWIDQQKYD